MRATLVLLGCLASGLAHAEFAEGQNQLSDPKKTISEFFWKQLYGSGGTTLYCGKPFSNEDSTLTASPVYSSKQLKTAMRCTTDRQCTIMNPRYPYIVSDLHNYYPALTRIELARRNAQFADLNDAATSKFSDIGCDLKSSFQQVEPRDEAKGNIARAIFYMHVEYDLPIVGQATMLKQWHELDPPDAQERERNDRIAAIEGTRNRFIDDPALVNQLIRD